MIKLNTKRTDRIQYGLRPTRADQWYDVGTLRQDPRYADLLERCAYALSHATHGRSVHILIRVADRLVRQVGDSVFSAIVDRRAVERIVYRESVLDRGDVRYGPRPSNLVNIDIAQSDRLNLAELLEVAQDTHAVLDWNPRVDVVQLVEVDGFNAEAAKAQFAIASKGSLAGIDSERVTGSPVTALRCDRYRSARLLSGECSSDNSLSERVDIGPRVRRRGIDQ
jgi:hypothetical protein